MKRISLIPTILVALFTLAITSFAYADCTFVDAHGKIQVGYTGTITEACQQGIEAEDVVQYTVTDANGGGVFLGAIDATTKITVDGEQLPMKLFKMLLEKHVTVVATVQADGDKSPQKVFEMTVVTHDWPLEKTVASNEPCTEKQAVSEHRDDFESRPISSFRVVTRKFLDPDSLDTLYIRALIPEEEAATYRPTHDDERLIRGPKDWVLMQIQIAKPFFMDLGGLTPMNGTDVEWAWSNTKVLEALENADTEAKRRRVLLANLPKY